MIESHSLFASLNYFIIRLTVFEMTLIYHQYSVFPLFVLEQHNFQTCSISSGKKCYQPHSFEDNWYCKMYDLENKEIDNKRSKPPKKRDFDFIER